MIISTARGTALPSQTTDRGPWRMDPPPPSGMQDLLRGALPGILVALSLLALLLAFGSVVSDGVRRGEQLRLQMSKATWSCGGEINAARHCSDAEQIARLRTPQTPEFIAVSDTQQLPQPR